MSTSRVAMPYQTGTCGVTGIAGRGLRDVRNMTHDQALRRTDESAGLSIAAFICSESERMLKLDVESPPGKRQVERDIARGETGLSGVAVEEIQHGGTDIPVIRDLFPAQSQVYRRI